MTVSFVRLLLWTQTHLLQVYKDRGDWERLAMSPRPSALLGLVLCLGQTIHMQEGLPPKPSLRAEPGPVIPRGRPVTLVCRSPVWPKFFRLEKEGRSEYHIQKGVSQDGSQATEARFHISSVREAMAGSYRCLYYDVSNTWSEPSERLQVQVREEDVSTPPSGPASRDYTVENSIRLGLAGVVLLTLVAILVEAGLSRRRSPQGPQE
ncbi:leukocyte-associated immunoglobulin-like receptor 2 [Myotis daubentonii]|uniref:leukocyte-associated immunoglobulin-like receptor 2 n=1 Tax=Myotis daubentonii TaxID=98922 RepID=UPI002873601E|nr:leukocyte-associated immunoglobulin-like receptor 2 [Myotis daubentonii]